VNADILTLTSIVKTFGGTRALDDVSFRVGEREIVGLIGANGAGKSTLLRVIAGYIEPDSGEYRIRGEQAAIRSPRDARSRGIAMVSQELDLMPDRSVADNIYIGAPASRGGFVQDRRLHAEAREQLARIGAAHIDTHAFADSLTPVDQKLVTVARALAQNPEVLILDEPTAALPIDAAGTLLPLFTRLAAEGTAIIYVSHRLAEVSAICGRVVAMRNGVVVGDLPIAEATRPVMVELVGGKVVEVEPVRAAPNETAAVVVSAKSLAGHFVHDVALEVRAGEIVGIGGLQGSGRSELLRLMMGVQPITAGTLDVLGSGACRSARDAVRRRVGYIAEGRGRMAMHGLDVAENMTIATLRRMLNRIGLVSRKAQIAATVSMSERLKVKGLPDALIGSLSGGNQQKVFLGRWLLNETQLLLLDEPTAGIDVGARADFHRLLRELARSGAAVIVASAEPEELALVCDRVYVMVQGGIAEEFVAPFDPQQIVAASYSGI